MAEIVQLLVLLVVLVPAPNQARECRRLIDSFIVNGAEAARGQLPWQVAINVTTTRQQSFCGGTILAEKWILTSAQCIQGAQEAVIIAGTTFLDSSSAQIVTAARFILHEDYESESIRHNIGLIRLKNPLEFNCDVSSIALPKSNPAVDSSVVTSGWGSQGKGPVKDGEFLRYTSLKILSQQKCNEPFHGIQLPPEIICAGSTTTKPKGICAGDTGGPLVISASSRNPILVGISSFYSGQGCDFGYPSWFISTYYYKNWIAAVIG